jgi:hypothetical protein
MGNVESSFSPPEDEDRRSSKKNIGMILQNKPSICRVCGSVIENPKVTGCLCAYCHFHIKGRTFVDFLAQDKGAAARFARNRDADNH